MLTNHKPLLYWNTHAMIPRELPCVDIRYVFVSSFSSTATGKYDYGSEAANEAAWTAFQDQLVACERCERKFAPDRLEVHLRTCKGKNASISSFRRWKLKRKVDVTIEVTTAHISFLLPFNSSLQLWFWTLQTSNSSSCPLLLSTFISYVDERRHLAAEKPLSFLTGIFGQIKCNSFFGLSSLQLLSSFS